jgi:hypothetical protein
MRAIGEQVKDPKQSCYLRCSESILRTLQEDIDNTVKKAAVDPQMQNLVTIKNAMMEKLKNGYSLVRYRVQSGEETVGLSRGALLPVVAKTPIDSWPFASNNGQDYQIFDTKLGLMDVSYSSAWQLGKVSNNLFEMEEPGIHVSHVPAPTPLIRYSLLHEKNY